MNSVDYAVGFNFAIKKNAETVGYIAGTKHGNNLSLSPLLVDISQKVSKLAFENALSEKREEEIMSVAPRVAYSAECNYYAYNSDNYNKNKLLKFPIFEHDTISEDEEKGTEKLILLAKGETFDSVTSLETPRQHATSLYYCEFNSEHTMEQIENNEITEDEIKSINFHSIVCFNTGDEMLAKKIKKWNKVQDPAYHHYVVEDRSLFFSINAEPLIKDATPEEKVLIGVGWSHLFGKKGLLHRLKENLGNEYSIEKLSGSV